MSEIQSNIFVSTIVIEDDKALMIREGKDNYGQRGTWNFPAGHAEYGEGLVEAAERETLEETGYTVKVDGIVAIQKKDFHNLVNTVVFFSGKRTSGEQAEPEQGTDRVEFVPVDRVRELNTRFPELSKIAIRAANGKVASLDILAFENIEVEGAEDEI